MSKRYVVIAELKNMTASEVLEYMIQRSPDILSAMPKIENADITDWDILVEEHGLPTEE